VPLQEPVGRVWSAAGSQETRRWGDREEPFDHPVSERCIDLRAGGLGFSKTKWLQERGKIYLDGCLFGRACETGAEEALLRSHQPKDLLLCLLHSPAPSQRAPLSFPLLPHCSVLENSGFRY